MKWIILILMMLMMVIIVPALEDCERLMVKGDLPCSIKSAWDYPDDCNTYTIDIFNENLTLVRTATMADYGSLTNFCNITFGAYTNETELGSYLLNFSNKDTVLITIGKEDNMIAIIMGLIFVMIFFAVFGFVFDNWGAKILGYGIALIQLLNIVHILYINELNQSLAPALKLNFTITLWLTFGIGLISLIMLSISLISMGKGADTPEEDKKWGRID